jgi:hypothetical protein
VQVLTDGDEELERCVKESFPEAEHTLDIVHVKEHIWEAGRFVYAEGSDELAQWVKRQERLLYKGQPLAVIDNVSAIKRLVGTKARERVKKIEEYLRKRVPLMNYRKMRRQDLEVATGMVEGAVRHVIGKRFDNGSMRWIKERAEALLQLRCIEINGDWDRFQAFVQRRLADESRTSGTVARLLTTKPGALPTSAARRRRLRGPAPETAARIPPGPRALTVGAIRGADLIDSRAAYSPRRWTTVGS